MFYNLTAKKNETVNLFLAAVQWEKSDMDCTIASQEIEKQTRIIRGKKSTAEEIALAKVRLAKAQKALSSAESVRDIMAEDHENAISMVLEGSNEHAANTETAFRNLLRLSCCDENSRYFSLALLGGEEFKGVYDALVALHDPESEGVGEYGLHQYSATDGKALSEELQAAVKRLIWIPISTDICKKVSVKLNKKDLNALHESFVTDLAVQHRQTKKDGKVCTGYEYTYAIKRIQNKKSGTVTYDGARFRTRLAKILYSRLFAVSK